MCNNRKVHVQMKCLFIQFYGSCKYTNYVFKICNIYIYKGMNVYILRLSILLEHICGDLYVYLYFVYMYKLLVYPSSICFDMQN